jgi:lysyl-tRNA synthetase class 2
MAVPFASAGADAVVVVYAVVLLTAGVVCALKGKWWMLAIGLVIHLTWFIGALRLARPNSWWARWRYDDAQREAARAWIS